MTAPPLAQKLFRAAALATALALVFTPGRAQAQEEAPPEDSTAAVQLAEAWTLSEALSKPESVVYDAERGVLYVSNIKGDASEAGAVTERFPAKGATFLNDVTAGHVYVSDSGTGALYRLADGRLTAWLEGGGALRAPNGVYAEPAHLVVAAGDSAAENPGSARYLQAVSYETKEITPLKDRAPLGGIDAVEPDGRGGYFLTDWGAGRLMHFTSERGAAVLEELGQGTADLDYAAEEEMLFLPVMMSDRLVAYRVRWP